MNLRAVRFFTWIASGVLCFSLPDRLFAATRIRIGYSAITTTQAPLWAAEDRGLFQKYGLEPELIYLAGGSKIALALESESIQLVRFNVASAVDARLAGGAAITETIFSWPGMGRLGVEAALGRDYPLVMAITLVVAAGVIGVNVVVDVVYRWADPRMRI